MLIKYSFIYILVLFLWYCSKASDGLVTENKSIHVYRYIVLTILHIIRVLSLCYYLHVI